VDGTWERVFTILVAQADADEDLGWAGLGWAGLGWAVSVDSTIVPAHSHAAGARYEKTAAICLAGLHIADLFLWSAR
jgi:hypothetical protein